VAADHLAKPPKGTTHVVLDTPAGLHGSRLFKDVMKHGRQDDRAAAAQRV
jgi:chromosome partitioning protein